MVRVTVSWVSGCTWPSRALQRVRLWASTAQPSQAAFAKNRPGGAVLHAGAVFEVADGEFDGGVVAVKPIHLDGGQVDVVMKAWCRQSGQSCAWAGSVSRVRRTTSRRGHWWRPLPVTWVVSATWASPPSG